MGVPENRDTARLEVERAAANRATYHPEVAPTISPGFHEPYTKA